MVVNTLFDNALNAGHLLTVYEDRYVFEVRLGDLGCADGCQQVHEAWPAIT